MRKFVSFLLIILTTLAFCGCRDDVLVDGIEVAKSQYTVQVGDTCIIDASVIPHNADNDGLTWESSDDKIATVKNGIVRAIKSGSVSINAITREGGYQKIIDVTCIDNQLIVSPDYNDSDDGFGLYKFNRINDALASSENDDVIIVKDGIYNEVVSITKNVKLIGENATISGVFIVGYPTLEKPVKEAIIQGFHFTNTSKKGLDEISCIYIGGSTDELTIKNCTFVGDGNNNAITTLMTEENKAVLKPTIQNCSFDNYNNAIYFEKYVSNAKICDNSFNHCTMSATLQGSQMTEFKSNHLENSGLIKFKHASVGSRSIIIKDNIINNYTIPLMIMNNGDYSDNIKLKLDSNIFDGILFENMTDVERATLISCITIDNENIRRSLLN